MKSVKPGRGPSFMAGIGSVGAAVFGIIWTIAAASMGAPTFFCLFGVVFVIIGIAQAAYNFKNAAGKNRFSTFDITDESEEPDPLNQRFGEPRIEHIDNASENGNFCPYCGSKVNSDYEFCRNCGKRI